jgi:thioredoxin-like negative regulator of GroEL
MKVLKFSAEWCTPCKQMTKWLNTQGYDYDIVEVPIETNQELVQIYGVRSVPTLIMLDEDNNVKKTIVGFNIPKLEAFLQI